MNRWWLPVAGIGAVGVAVVGFATFAGHTVQSVLSGGPERAAALVGPAEGEKEPGDEPDTAGPSVNLDHPSDADWRFLEGVLRDGTPEAARSAAHILVEIARLPGVEMLFDAAARGGPDADQFCLSALDILRTQERSDAIVSIWNAIGRVDPALGDSCRVELEDRRLLVGADDARHVRGLWQHPEPAVRLHVVDVLGREVEAHRDVLEALASSDPSSDVRERVTELLSR